MRAGTNNQTSFVQDYAAKRAAQMERARQLKEMREQKRRDSDPALGSPTDAGHYHQEPQQQRLPAASGAPQQPSAGSAQRLGMMGGYSQQQQQTQQYPPPLPNRGPHLEPMQQPQQLNSQPYSPPSSLTAHARGGTASVRVTENDFYRAVEAGIITQDQARQIWAVVSSNPNPGPSQQAPQHAAVFGGTMERRPSSNAGGAPQQYEPDAYAAPSHAEEDPEAGYGVRPRNSQGQRAAAASKQSKRPEWNSDYAEESVQDSRDYDYGNNAPQARPAQQQTPQQRRTNGGAAQQQQQQRDRPAWNDEWNDRLQEEEHERQQQEAQARAKQLAKAKPAPKKIHTRDWNNDFSTDEAPGIPDEPPPLPGQRAPKANPFAKQQPSRASQQQQPQQSFDEEPARRAPSSRASRQQQPVRESREPAPTASSYPSEAPGDDIHEFQAQKDRAAEEFQRAVEEADNNERMVPCGICGRTFREGIIARHEKACQTANKKRKTFDMKSQRLEGVEGIENVRPMGGGRNVPSRAASKGAAARGGAASGNESKPAGAMPKWKAQHMQFQAALKSMQHVKSPGGGNAGPPPPLPDEFDTRVPCPHCGRKFASDTAERHIPKCKTMINKPKTLQRRR